MEKNNRAKGLEAGPTMETRGSLPKYTIEELELEDLDLNFPVTMGVIVSGTPLNVLRLRKFILSTPELKMSYHTVRQGHLRVVDKENYEGYEKWRKNRR